MKAFLLVGSIFSAFLIFVGYVAKNDAGNALGRASIVAGVIVGLFVGTVWILSIYKEKTENDR